MVGSSASNAKERNKNDISLFRFFAFLGFRINISTPPTKKIEQQQQKPQIEYSCVQEKFDDLMIAKDNQKL
jgi:hypothetical protein